MMHIMDLYCDARRMGVIRAPCDLQFFPLKASLLLLTTKGTICQITNMVLAVLCLT